jgi:multiple sugar transport system substrate-binding protein
VRGFLGNVMRLDAPLIGLTWDHPRGYAALEQLERLDETGVGGLPPVRWHRRALEDFELGSLPRLASRYDLLVIDHPTLACPGATDCLVPMEELFGTAELAAYQLAAVGPSARSYSIGGRIYALPIDAAAQVGVADVPIAQSQPKNWRDVLSLCRQSRATLCLGGSHAFLMLAAICAGQGQPIDLTSDAVFDDGIEEGLNLMRMLLDLADPVVSFTGPISVLESLAREEGPQYCPLVFGYVTYQRGDTGRLALSAFDAPGASENHASSVLGGTGIAVSRRGTDLEVASEHIRRILSLPVQRELYAEVGGQSSLTEVWEDPEINRKCNYFYSRTRLTMDGAWTRPALSYLPELQKEASKVIQHGLRQRTPARRIRSQLTRLLARLRPPCSSVARPV